MPLNSLSPEDAVILEFVKAASNKDYSLRHIFHSKKYILLLRYNCMANDSLFDALISFTPCVPAGHLPFLSFLHTKERSELVFTNKALTLHVSPARVWKMACGWCPQACLSWLYLWLQAVSLALPPSCPLIVAAAHRWRHHSPHLSKVLLQMVVASSCPCAPTTDKPSSINGMGSFSGAHG